MASQQLPAKVESSSPAKKLEPASKEIASGTAEINPQVENIVGFEFELFKEKPLSGTSPVSDYKLEVKAGKNGIPVVKDMNADIGAMPDNTIVILPESLPLSPNLEATDEMLYYKLVDQAPTPGNSLVCYGTKVKVVPF